LVPNLWDEKAVIPVLKEANYQRKKDAFSTNAKYQKEQQSVSKKNSLSKADFVQQSLFTLKLFLINQKHCQFL
jgi:hypothetical protein